MPRLKHIALSSAVLVALAGCGHTPTTQLGDLRITHELSSRWIPVNPPASEGPARDVSAVTFRDRRTGFLTASSPRLEFRLYEPPGPSRVQRTGDGGRTWRTVWTGGPAALGPVVFPDRRHGFVFGLAFGRKKPSPFLLRTDDGGASWQQLKPRVPPQALGLFGWPALVVRFATSRVAFAVGDPDYSGYARLLRTTDGGRTWRSLRPARSQGVVAFDALDARDAFVVAWDRKCNTRLWRTDDGGDTWKALGPCPRRYGFTAVDFLDTRTGFVAGGNPYYLDEPPALVVRRTDDGGASWRTVFVDPSRPRDKPFVRLHFVDARHGWAARGGCKIGQNSPCAGDVWVTADGGRTWRDSREEAVQVEALGTRDAWIVPPCEEDCGVLFRTADGGRTWIPHAGRAGAALESVRANADGLVLGTAAGFFAGDVRARTWTLLHTTLPRHFLELKVVRPGLLVADDYERRLALSVDGGHTWRRARAPVPGLWNLDFEDARHGLFGNEPGFSESAVYGTDDGARTWHRLRTPFLPDGGDQVSLAPGLWIIQSFKRSELAFSEDRGAHWRVLRLPRGALCNATAGGDHVAWLACELDLSGGRTRTVLYRSTDGGRTWTHVRSPHFAPEAISAVDARTAYAVTGFGVPGLWRTDDGGGTWHELWPRLPTPG